MPHRNSINGSGTAAILLFRPDKSGCINPVPKSFQGIANAQPAIIAKPAMDIKIDFIYLYFICYSLPLGDLFREIFEGCFPPTS